jgi:metallo-beta-lactamase family protein
MNRRRMNPTSLCLGVLLGLGAVANAHAGEIGRPTRATVSVFGAARQVSGSLTVLDTGSARWLIDCGAQYPEGDDDQRQAEADRRSATLPVDARDVAAVFVTHAHLDHIGRLPLLVQRGFSGPVYLTAATRELAPVMLDMQVRYDRGRVREWTWSKWSSERAQTSSRRLTLHWRTGCGYRQKINPGNLQTAQGSLADVTQRLQDIEVSTCRSCATDEVAAILALCRVMNYATPVDVAPGITATFLDAGHIPGSASILLRIDVRGTQRRLLFSGDLGNCDSGLIPGPKPAPGVDAVFVETTYGAVRRDPPAPTERARFRREVAEVVRRGGVAWIPAFALERTQKMLYELRLAQQEGLLPTDVPIFCPSPTAQEITALYRQHQRDGWFHEAIARDGSALSPPGLVEGSRLPKNLPRPCVLLTTSGMMDRASSADLTAQLVPQESTSVFLVSYQDPASTGGWLKEGRQSILVNGREIPVRATVSAYHCFSAHADGNDLDGWLTRVHRHAKVVLVHGEPERIDARVSQMQDAGWKNVVAAEEGRPISLESDSGPATP